MGRPGPVAIAYIHKHLTSHSFTKSLTRLMAFDRARDGLVVNVLDQHSGTADGIATARNNAVRGFLTQTQAEWLMFIDTDMGFEEDALYRLLASADPVDRPVMGGLCFIQREVELDGLGGARGWPQASIFDFREGRFRARVMYPVAQVTECDATGGAFILIHRSVLERFPEGGWFDHLDGSDGRMGEDIAFCARVRGLGLPIHVNTSVRTSHHKSVWLAEVDFWMNYLAEPATERVEVIVPTRRRPHRARPFAESLFASTGLARLHVVCDPDDRETADAWREVLRPEVDSLTVVAPLRGRTATFSRKVNAAVDGSQYRDPWVLLVGDDVRFHPGWLDQALAVHRHLDAKVIGTNDLHSPRSIAGVHSPHPLIARSYIAEVGASWDGPGVTCHEGYDHNFVDDEIVTAAKRRGVWQMSLGSFVEHRHPLWTDDEPDATYKLGQARYADDKALFMQRFIEQQAPAPVEVDAGDEAVTVDA